MVAHASLMSHAVAVGDEGGAVAIPAPPAAREAANDTTRAAPPAPITRAARRLTADEQRAELQRAERRAWLARLLAPALGLILFGLLWQWVAQASGQLPTPAMVGQSALTLFTDPFYRK